LTKAVVVADVEHHAVARHVGGVELAMTRSKGKLIDACDGQPAARRALT
jgi:hypothetical protein